MKFHVSSRGQSGVGMGAWVGVGALIAVVARSGAAPVVDKALRYWPAGS